MINEYIIPGVTYLLLGNILGSQYIIGFPSSGHDTGHPLEITIKLYKF